LAVTEEETQVVAAQSGRQDDVAGDPLDDWLAEDLDWSEPHGSTPRPRPGRRPGSSAGDAGEGPTAIADVFRRRRAVALIGAVALVAALVLIPLLAFGGGGSSPPAATTTQTTPAQTTPAQTTTPTTSASTTTPTTGATTKLTLPPSGSLKSGATGTEVKTLQQTLNSVGSASLKVDGNFGPATEQAVVTFQQANGLTADGVVGPKTAQALNAALAQQQP
jgi:Putative peptidoglycan binding domain